ncbi:Ti-type conjugative transfer relaxase TraA [Sphingopyxis flava]|uniref:Plasmid mobilization system relaxase n=1 Tax=Sphingopyxis flava TaxID=1507287 RepID=A0A1T5F720_9SPHN|nr:Ti-type conjugative transfer relaxase TraA [Sphingopyxis flava]SKB91966.1 plasmid mobilization system relaxase [Sphingopyxis flava]
MAIYHFQVSVISRSSGSSAVAAAAYRSAGRLYDERYGRTRNFSNKAGVVHSEVLLPEGANERWLNREWLWNDVEAREIRKDAQLAREIVFAIPSEMTQGQGIELARDFVGREFVDRGMVADLNVHWDIGARGGPNRHAHVMLTMRETRAGQEGPAAFGPKVTEWGRRELLMHWRAAWADHVNERLATLDIDARIDHRSLKAQGSDLEPQNKIGAAALRMAARGLHSDRLAEHAEIARSNGEGLIANPATAIDAITHGQATFTTRDLAMFAHRHSDGKEQFDAVMAAVKSSPELISLGKDARGDERFTSRAMIEIEKRLERATDALDARRRHGVGDRHREHALARASARGFELSAEQRGALEHITSARGISNVIGYAGTGKSALLGAAREAWEAAGYQVQGAALAGVAAEGLEQGSGIASRTLASLEHQWANDRARLTGKHVLVIDEAGLVGTRQLERIVSEAERRGAKIVLVGDPQQLQAIEAGAAFRAAAERHGAIEIMDIRRQRADWQREATRELATGRTGEAIARYAEAGFVHAADTREAARTALVDAWERDRQTHPEASRIILTHTNAERKQLNKAVRERLKARGALGDGVALEVERGTRVFAPGDRIMFLKNERALGVKNGSLGTVQSVHPVRMGVMLDDGRSVAFDLKDYAHVDHGYAATIHKAQGMTVDRAQVLATQGVDSHSIYVALSRHRLAVDLYYGRDDFANQSRLISAASRERGKDMASDYRGQRGSGIADLRSRIRSLGASSARSELEKAIERFARVTKAIVEIRREGGKESPQELETYRSAGKALDVLRPGGATELREAFGQSEKLTREAAEGRTGRAIAEMEQRQAARAAERNAAAREQARLTAETEKRAEQFVSAWTKESARAKDGASHAARREARAKLASMAKSLERDPELGALLLSRRKQLGLDAASTKKLSQDIQQYLGSGRGIGISM